MGRAQPPSERNLGKKGRKSSVESGQKCPSTEVGLRGCPELGVNIGQGLILSPTRKFVSSLVVEVAGGGVKEFEDMEFDSGYEHFV